MSTRVRTPLIIVAIAALVWAVPSGDNSAQAVGNALSAVMLAALVLLAVRVYRDGRGRLDVLEDTHRLMLYAGIGLFVVAMAARPSLTGTGLGTLLFVLLLAAPVALLWTVWQRWRDA